jgi:hypothetical protein
MIYISEFHLQTIISLAILILAVTSDFITTWLCLRRTGKEGNPVIVTLFKKIGVLGTFGLMACLWVLLIVFRWLPADNGSQTAIALTYWLVPMNNVNVLRRLNRKAHALQETK